MTPVHEIPFHDRILGGLWGAVVGDALGVPVEFTNRTEVQANPVTEMRGYGTHDQQAGTWSDDSPLLVCTVESLINYEFDTTDMGRRFLSWYQDGVWTARGDVFDVGLTTSDALIRIRNGVPAEDAGGRDEHSNGNGSLMRILPVALRFANESDESIKHRTARVSAITHAHPRSRMACTYYGLLVRELLSGMAPMEATIKTQDAFSRVFSGSPELRKFAHLVGDLSTKSEDWIVSTGYVIHTLTASLWCLLTTKDYRSCVLKAVNLGGDTDTTGCVAGGLAGVAYGKAAIPEEWINQLARSSELETLFTRFVELR